MKKFNNLAKKASEVFESDNVKRSLLVGAGTLGGVGGLIGLGSDSVKLSNL